LLAEGESNGKYLLANPNRSGVLRISTSKKPGWLEESYQAISAGLLVEINFFIREKVIGLESGIPDWLEVPGIGVVTLT
jgi:hypothetical protein